MLLYNHIIEIRSVHIPYYLVRSFAERRDREETRQRET